MARRLVSVDISEPEVIDSSNGSSWGIDFASKACRIDGFVALVELIVRIAEQARGRIKTANL